MRTRSPGVAVAVFAAFALVVVACSDDDDSSEVSAEFTGDGCVYSGPSEFELGDEFEITVSDVTEERMDVGFAVTKVADGMTVDEYREQGNEAVAEDASGAFLYSEVTEEGEERLMSYTLDEAGTWVVSCFVFPIEEDFPATAFEVVEKS